MSASRPASTGARRVISFNPWVSLSAGFMLQFLAGTPYLFGAFAADLRALFGISQSEVQLLGTLLNIGMWLGVTGGLFLQQFGRLWTVLTGSLLLFLGYFGMFLASSGIALGPGANFYPLWCILFFMAGQGIAFLSVVALKVNILNFTLEQRGQIVGVLQCAFALSGGIFSVVRSAFFGTDVASLLLLMSILCSVGSLFMGLVVNATGGVGKSMVPRFYGAEELVGKTFSIRIKLYYAFSIFCAGYVFVVSILKPFLEHEALIGLAVIAIVAICCVALLPIRTGAWVLWRVPRKNHQVERHDDDDIDSGEETPLEQEPPQVAIVDDTSPLVAKKEEEAAVVVLEHEASSGSSLMSSIISLDFVLLFLIFFAGAGTSIATVNNMASLVQSKSFGTMVSVNETGVFVPIIYPETSLPNRNFATTFVALFSSMSTLGRLAFGFVSDRFQHRFHRPFWIMCSLAILVISQIFNLFAPVSTLFPLIIFIGFSYGGLFAVVPATVADFYGPEKFGVLYGIMTLAPALGSLLLATVTYGQLSDHFGASSFIVVRGGDGDITRQCVGPECFQYAFIIFISLLALALGASLFLWWKNRSDKPRVY